MKNKELFDRTIGILVKAYQNDTLQHSNCYACAIGNLVAANNGVKIQKIENRFVWDNSKPEWQAIHSFCNGRQSFDNPVWGNTYEGLNQLLSTGYTTKETAKIEYAFEMAEYGDNQDTYMFNGLMSVVDALMEIHEGNETEIAEAKQLFVLS